MHHDQSLCTRETRDARRAIADATRAPFLDRMNGALAADADGSDRFVDLGTSPESSAPPDLLGLSCRPSRAAGGDATDDDRASPARSQGLPSAHIASSGAPIAASGPPMVVARGRAALRGCMPSFARTRRPRSRRVEAEKSAMLCGIARSTTPDEVRRFTPGPEVPPGGATLSETSDGRVDDFWAWTRRRSTRRRGDARPRPRIQRLCRARAVRGTSCACLWAGRAWNPSVADHDRGGAPGAVLGQQTHIIESSLAAKPQDQAKRA
jgi:hypothetical protein